MLIQSNKILSVNLKDPFFKIKEKTLQLIFTLYNIYIYICIPTLDTGKFNLRNKYT